MSTSIKLKKSSVAGKVPTVSDLNYGELAINYADGKIYYKNSSNQIKAFIDSAAVATLASEGGGGGGGGDADTLDGQDGTYYLNYNNFTNTPTIPTLGNDFVDSSQVSAIITADVDASFINALTIDADTLGSQSGSYYLNYNNFTNTPTIPTLGNDYVDSAQVSSIISATTIDADTLDGINSTSFLRSDAADTKTSGDLGFSDNVKATFGASADLEIYHDGSNSYITDNGTGFLNIGGYNSVKITNPNGTNVGAVFNTAGAVDLNYNGSTKLSTSSSGIDITDQLSIESTTGYGRIEIGGTSGAFIDLKSPMSDDYDGRLITTGSGLTITSSSGNAVNIQHSGSTKLSTTSSGINVTGTVTADDAVYVEGSSPRLQVQDTDGTNQFGFLQQQGGDLFIRARNDTADGRIVLAGYGGSTTTNRLDINSGGDVRFWNSTGAATKLVWDTSDEALEFDDDVKATFGTSADLQIYHDGSNSYVSEQGQGVLYIQGSNNVQIETATGENMAVFLADNAVELYYDNAKKLETTSTGVNITGGLQTTGDVVIGGDLQVTGTTTTINTEDLTVTDNMIYMNAGESSGSPTLSIDVGWAGNVNDDGSYAHVGMFRDATDNTFKVFEGYTPEPDAAVEINTGHASFSLAPFAARTIEADSATINTSLLVNGAHNNGGKADFAVATGGTAQISLYGDQVQIGSNDMNWSSKIYHSGGLNLGAWDANTIIFNEGGSTSRNIVFSPSYQGTRTERLAIIGDTGRVGIGTSSPTELLHVKGTTGTTSALVEVADGSQASLDLKNSAGEFRLITVGGELYVYDQGDNAERFRIDTSGNVGIGNTNPSYALDVSSSGADARIYLEDGATGAPIYMRSMGSGEAGLYVGDNIRLTAQSGDFNTITNNLDMTWSVDNGSTDHMYLSTAGNLGIGTSSPGTKLDVNGTVTATAVKVASTAQIEDFTNTTSSTSQATIASWSSSTFGGAKVLVEAKDGSNRHITELLITHDGSAATYTEYGSIWTSSALASYEVDISSGTVRLRVTPASSNSTSYKIMTTILYS